MHSQNLEKVTTAMVSEAMDLNVNSALRLTQLSVKWMGSSKLKAIVNVSSIAGLRAYPGSTAYKLSKAARDQLTRCSALELAPKGIRVNSVKYVLILILLISRILHGIFFMRLIFCALLFKREEACSGLVFVVK